MTTSNEQSPGRSTRAPSRETASGAAMFRDRDALEVLRDEALPRALAGVRADTQVRVWVADCATGEDLWSLAMVVREVLDDVAPTADLRIFATDPDEAALETARAAVYGEASSDGVPERYRRRFFEDIGDRRLRVVEELRRVVRFSAHEIHEGAAFMRLHLLRCPDAEDPHVADSVRLALEPGGLLLLGSDAVRPGAASGFEPLSERINLHRRLAPDELVAIQAVLASLEIEHGERFEALRIAHDDLDTFFHSAQLATVFLDGALKIVRTTPEAARLLKLPDPAGGRSLLSVADQELVTNLQSDVTAALQMSHPTQREVRSGPDCYRREVVPCRWAAHRGDGVAVTFTDVSGLRASADELARREQRQAALALLGLQALRSEELGLERLIQSVVEVVAETLTVELVQVLEIDGDELELAGGKGWRDDLLGRARVAGGADSQAGYTVRVAHPVAITDLAAETRFRPSQMAVEQGAVSGLSCLVAGSEQPWGVIAAFSTKPRVFTPDEVNFLQSVANVLGSAVQRHEVEASLRANEERFRLVARATNDGIWDIDLAAKRVWCNGVYESMFGRQDQSFAEAWDWWAGRLHPEDRDRVLTSFRAAFEGGADKWSQDYRMRRADGTYADVFDRAWISRDERGRPTRVIGALADVTERRAVQRRLKSSEERLRLALEGGRMGAWEWEPRTGRVFWDERQYALLDHPVGSPVSDQHFFARVHPDDLEGLRKKLEDAVAVAGSYDAEFRIVRPDGEVRWLAGLGQVVRDGDEAMFFGVNYDITARKNAEESRREQERRKDEFIAILGHELRNPIAAIDTGLRVLGADESDDEERTWALRMMTAQVAQTTRLIQDLLDLSRIAQGRIRLTREWISVAEIVHRAVDAVRLMIAEKGHALSLALPEEDVLVHADAARLEQVTANLLSNAATYSAAGGSIQVRVRKGAAEVSIEVADEGIGLAPESQSTIFEPFSQVRAAGAVREGLGIGLSLAKQIIELHGGAVRVASEGLGLGSTFTVTLPFTGTRAGRAPAKRGATPRIDGAPSVLVVDDNEGAARGLAMLLQRLGARSSYSLSGEDAMRRVRDERPRVVLLDIGLPDVSGYVVADELRREGFLEDTLLVAVTGFGQDDARRRMTLAGFDEALLKPVDLDAVVGLINDRDRRIAARVAR